MAAFLRIAAVLIGVSNFYVLNLMGGGPSSPVRMVENAVAASIPSLINRA